MKKLISFLLIMAFVLTFSSVCVAQQSSLGRGNIALKLSYINFTVDDDTGVYAGLEGYREIRPNLYLGAEVGYANSISEADIFVPIELNLKYAIRAAPEFVIDLGVGGSYNYVEEEHSKNDWLFGAQFFVDLNYIIEKFFMGINVKYQLTEHYREDSDIDFNNWRLGGQIGIMF
ncbi:MAG: outer membrane beta-barrel protein [Nitrospirota bacterium]